MNAGTLLGMINDLMEEGQTAICLWDAVQGLLPPIESLDGRISRHGATARIQLGSCRIGCR
jgi:hypothetical protein